MNSDDDQLRLECGVFGVFDVADASRVVALGLHALQHRGQEACGIAAFDGQGFQDMVDKGQRQPGSATAGK